MRFRRSNDDARYVISKHLTTDELQQLVTWEEDEQKLITLFVRTMSGRRVDKLVYVSKSDYLALKEPNADAQAILSKYISADDGERLEGWEEAQVKLVKTNVRTKSGRIIERTMVLNKEDYELYLKLALDNKDTSHLLSRSLAPASTNVQLRTIKTLVRTKSGKMVEKTITLSNHDYEELQRLKRAGQDSSKIFAKYMSEKPENWGEGEQKAIKTFVRTGSGRMIEKTVFLSKEDYEKVQKLKKEGKSADEILSKYVPLKAGEKLDGWEKSETEAKKVVKTKIRTKSGRIIEKTILMTKEEYEQFEKSGGNVNDLRKFLDIGKDDVIQDVEKASTVFSLSDNESPGKSYAPPLRPNVLLQEKKISVTKHSSSCDL